MKTEYFSTRQVAACLGVSESSLKRWCDRGVLPSIRTAGGHRRLPLSGVIQFVRNSELDLQRPDLIGLRRVSDSNRSSSHRNGDLHDALNRGDVESVRQSLIGRFLGGDSLAEIADRVIAPAMWKIGHQWEEGEIDIYQEHRATEIVCRILNEMHRMLPMNYATYPHALGGAPADDNYRIPTQMVEIVLAEAGWRATSLGSRLPLTSLLSAIKRDAPELVWLTISYVDNENSLLEDLRSFANDISANLPIVVGGRAVNDDIRDCLKNAMYCQDMRQLATFAKSLKTP